MSKVTIVELFATLTAEEKAACKASQYGIRGVVYCRGKKAAQAFEARGFKMEKVSAQMYCIDWEQAKELNALATAHGEASKIIRIDGKYCESMGAFETVTVEDCEGNQWEVGNMYDTKVCFRLMSEQQIIDYVNTQ